MASGLKEVRVRGAALPLFRNNAGFSLVELVSVIVLISILAAFIAPKMIGTSGFDEFIVRDQLISAIRFVQQRAMYNHVGGRCYRVNVTANNYSVDVSDTGSSPFLAHNDFAFGAGEASVASALAKVTLSPSMIFFDGLGNPVNTCRGASVGNRAISVVGASTTQLCIYSTGYIRAGACI